MAVPLAIPSSPSGAHSPVSTDGSNGPQTPVSPTSMQTLSLPSADGSPTPAAATTAAPAPSTASNANSKRKPSRRANTAERRATHNAVERQRRETLNSRFLDLAALLPNLSQIRRPSKSSIVNSSIAHIHSSRRHRLLAARELRLLKLETDALRREINEWRDRSGLPRVDEPVRGDAFQLVLSGEVEVLAGVPIEEDDAEYAGDDYGDDDYGRGSPASAPGPDEPEELRAPLAHAAAAALLKGQEFAQPLHVQTLLPRAPMVVQSPGGMAFENPAMAMFDGPAPLSAPAYGGGFQDDKWPPMHGFAHGMPLFSPAQVQNQHYVMLQRQALLQQQQQQQQQREDAPARRERSGSMGSAGSGYAQGGGSPPASFERRAGWDDGMGMMGMQGLQMGMMKNAAMGGGGNGHAYAMML